MNRLLYRAYYTKGFAARKIRSSSYPSLASLGGIVTPGGTGFWALWAISDVSNIETTSDEDFDKAAGKMFDLINFIVKKAITEPKELDELYQLMPENARNAAEAQDKKALESKT